VNEIKYFLENLRLTIKFLLVLYFGYFLLIWEWKIAIEKKNGYRGLL